jgi:glycogen synthase
MLASELRLRDRAEFTGTLEGAALEAAVSSAIAIVLPSLADETAGLVVVEQMMRGRVIFASDIRGLGEIFGRSGLKFPPGDVGALTECLRQVLADPELHSTLGRAARTRARRSFTQERMIANHAQLKNHPLNEPPNTPPSVPRPA